MEISGGGQVVIGGVALSCPVGGATLAFEEAFEPLSLRSQLSVLFYQHSSTASPSPAGCPSSLSLDEVMTAISH